MLATVINEIEMCPIATIPCFVFILSVEIQTLCLLRWMYKPSGWIWKSQIIIHSMHWKHVSKISDSQESNTNLKVDRNISSTPLIWAIQTILFDLCWCLLHSESKWSKSVNKILVKKSKVFYIFIDSYYYIILIVNPK